MLLAASENLAIVLSIIATATALISVGIQLWSAARDRPKLWLNISLRSQVGIDHSWLEIEVANRGRRPVTIKEVGLHAGDKQLIWARPDDESFEASFMGGIKFPFAKHVVLLEPGHPPEVAVSRLDGYFSWGLPADLPLRVYAMDAYNRRTWGEALPAVRMLLGHEVPFDPEPPEYLSKLRDDLRPARVEKPWKLWKRRELRRGWTDSEQLTTDDYPALTEDEAAALGDP
ncbi:MAG: hypothetical protein QOI31_2585 [Solirubrobacterales bacterium]|nr:hypothetical protein [Solirubrobacterales bacterium]